MARMIRDILTHPLLKGLDIDSPETTNRRSQIISQKPFLKQLYTDWYREMVAEIPVEPGGRILELGSGGGFLKLILPDLIRSDILALANIDIILDGHSLPFADCSLKGILMINVFHHLRDPQLFLKEACRCTIKNGFIIMVEPWNTIWSKVVYKNLHHETFEPEAREWNFSQNGPLSDANGALPWIVFQRDRATFQSQFPEWQLKKIHLHTPFRYLLSGGVSLRNFMPGFSFYFWRSVENLLQPFSNQLCMFATIVVHKAI